MTRGLLVKLPALVLLLAEWLALRGTSAAAVMGVTFLGWLAGVAYLVTSPRTQWLVPTVYRGPTSRPLLALTFDDGPHPEYTLQILDVLREHGACATFFVVGERARRYPEVVARAAREGHQIAAHTDRHSHTFHFWRARSMARDIAEGMKAVVEVTGVQPRFFRPPQGLRVPTLREALASLAHPTACVTWTVRGLDTIARSPQAIVARVSGALSPGAIVALHDGTGFGGGARRDATVAALRRLLPLVRERGLSCVTVERLLASQARGAA